MSKLRICVIDDNDLVRGAVSACLEGIGYEVFAAADGAAGLITIAETNAQIVLTDMLMPGVGGAALISLLREHHPQVAIVAMSGEPLRDGLWGCDAFLKKPFKPAELRVAIARALEARPARHTA